MPSLILRETVPRDPSGNHQYREAILSLCTEEGSDGANAREEVIERCRQDPVFFINAFGWARHVMPVPEIVPLVLYPRQELLIRELQRVDGKEDFHMDKSRGVGATTVVLYFTLHAWLFLRDSELMLISWKQEMVDGAHGSLMYKLDEMHGMLPGWMQASMRDRHARKQRRMFNSRTRSIIMGETSTPRAGRSLRVRRLFCDEFAFFGESPKDAFDVLWGTRDTCWNRIFCSTPNGPSNAFAIERSVCPNTFSFWWPDDPVKATGLARTDGGDLAELLPKSGWWSDNVEGLRGKLTSPWYEHQKGRATGAAEIAQELDIDYAGSSSQFFPEPMLQRIKVSSLMEPRFRGEILHNTDSGKYMGFSQSRDGPLRLWVPLSGPDHKAPADGEYVVGADIAAGSRDAKGATKSSSCAVAIEAKSGEVCADLCVDGTDPADFAGMVVALCGMFHEAFLIWEGNGPGLHFTEAVVNRLGYSAVFYRHMRKRKSKIAMVSMPGWWSTPDNKYQAFMAYRDALSRGAVVERCAEALWEHRLYMLTARTVVHSEACASQDPTGAMSNHSDRVIARVVAYKGMSERGYDIATLQAQVPGRGNPVYPQNCPYVIHGLGSRGLTTVY